MDYYKQVQFIISVLKLDCYAYTNFIQIKKHCNLIRNVKREKNFIEQINFIKLNAVSH